MQTQIDHLQPPIYSLEPDETGNKYIRVYNFEGSIPPQSDLLIPHRKDHYLLFFMRKGGARQWIDTTPFTLKDNTFYFVGPNRIIVKEDTNPLWSTGIAFTKEFLALLENACLSKLPIVRNPNNAYELILTDTDVDFVEDTLSKINIEYRKEGDWQQRMLGAYLTLLLTYLSKLYIEQYSDSRTSAEKLLLQHFQNRIDVNFREFHEVGDYASMLNISAGHFSEVIKSQTGMPAIKHIHERLVLEARRLLFHSNSTSKEIAFELGFSDASYFNRFFKRETGMTPSDFRSYIRKMYH